ncbi:MAG TPA: reverse transcriptase domain-containing protein [Bacillus sp. (in: firmicutes)]|nr:reverse transcriptase domain-containing protein [Bacillus sp. (in: firmicutes)]
MFHAMERIAYLSKVANSKKDLKFKDLYKMMLREELLEYAYDRIKSNKGSRTAGIDGINKKALEGNLSEVFKQLSDELYQQTYRPLPVRRVDIPKRSGGSRPLGIPALKDRIVQSAVKMILEAIYEPIFLDHSHGFRPKRSCQTAINHIIGRTFDWVVEGDIKGCFDNIKHGKLLDTLRKRIADEKFINLINKFLKSGYQLGFGTEGKLPIFQTKDGTPQGGIVSPVLANIYLHEFDKFMDKKVRALVSSERKFTPEYDYYRNKLVKIRRQIKKEEYPFRLMRAVKGATFEDTFLNGAKSKLINNRDEAVEAIRAYKKMSRKVQIYSNHWDLKGLGYVRYADDFVIVLARYNKRESQLLKNEITEWFETNLQLALSPAKTLITHSTDGFRFVGYDIYHRASKKGYSFADQYAKIYIPADARKRFEDKINNILRVHINANTADVIVAINRVISGWSHFYKVTNNWQRVNSKMDSFVFWKLAHWIAAKHRKSIKQILKNHYGSVSKQGRDVKRLFKIVGDKTISLSHCSDIKYTTTFDVTQSIMHKEKRHDWYMTPINESTFRKNVAILKSSGSSNITTYLELSQLHGETCFNCGTANVHLSIHHTKMVKRSKHLKRLDRIQAERDLPKVLLCNDCHKEAHPTTRTVKTLS